MVRALQSLAVEAVVEGASKEDAMATKTMLICAIVLGGCGVGTVDEEGAQSGAANQDLFSTRIVGSVTVVGDSVTRAFNANDGCNFSDQPNLSWATNETAWCGSGDADISVAERASCAAGYTLPAANFAVSGQSMTEARAQATNARNWALGQASPRVVMMLLGHNDICQANVNKYPGACGSADKDPNNYCRTTNFAYEKNFRQALDVLVTIPNAFIGIVHPVRVSQLCNFAHQVIIETFFSKTTCQGLWSNLRSVSNFVLGDGNGVCRSLTEDCSQARVEDAYTTWVNYRNILERVVAEYNGYGAGATIPYNATFGTGNVVRAAGVQIGTSNAIGNYKIPFKAPNGQKMVSNCDCYHPSDDGQNQLGFNVWKGVTCSTTSPCCNDNVAGDSTYNRGLCVNTITDGVTRLNGLW